MSKFWTVQINCPYCKLSQTHAISQRISMASKPQRTMCFNSEKQEGCKKPFDVSFEMQVKCMKVFDILPEKQKMILKPVFED